MAHRVRELTSCCRVTLPQLQCALAHILPGQPMSFDRKNKRAAQNALREAQANGIAQDPSQPSTSPASPPQYPRTLPPVSGIGKSLGRTSVDLGKGSATTGEANAWNRAALSTSPGGQGASNYLNPTLNDSEAVFGSPDGSETTLSRVSLAQSDQHQTPPAEPSFPHLSPRMIPTPLHPNASLSTAPSGLSQTLSQQFGSSNGSNRSSIAAQVMLGQQARRLSNNNEPLSPPRLSSQARLSFNGASNGDHVLGSSPPLAVPGAASTNGTGSIFGTSPFQGSRSLFMLSSYDSNEDGFPRSPPPRVGGLEEMRRTSSSGWNRNGMMYPGEEEDAIDDEEEEGNDEYEEGFLPSSLNDLLTPEEQRRRASRVNSSFNPFSSQSVPAELTLNKPPLPVKSVSTGSSAWGTLSRSVEGTNVGAAVYSPPPPTSRSLLSVGQPSFTSPPSDLFSSSPSAPTSSLHAKILARNSANGIYSSSFDPPSSNFGTRPINGTTSSTNGGGGVGAGNTSSLGISPSQQLAAPGSLPGGLAAGLSQLHLIPANHTGETPPASISSASSASYLFGGHSPASTTAATGGGGTRPTHNAWTGAPLSWGNGGGEGGLKSGHHVPPPTTRRLSSHHHASPLGGGGTTPREEEEEDHDGMMQFSLEMER